MYYALIGAGARNPDFVYRLTSGQTHDYTFYTNETFENLVTTAFAMEDSLEKGQLYVEAYKMILEDMPVIMMHIPKEDRLREVVLYPIGLAINCPVLREVRL